MKHRGDYCYRTLIDPRGDYNHAEVYSDLPPTIERASPIIILWFENARLNDVRPHDRFVPFFSMGLVDGFYRVDPNGPCYENP